MTSNSNRSRTGSDDEVRLAPPERQAQLDEMYQMLTAIGLAATREEQRKSPTVTAEKSIPLTLIGGFLGAGKTTVLNQLLSGDHGLPLAVIRLLYQPVQCLEWVRIPRLASSNGSSGPG